MDSNLPEIECLKRSEEDSAEVGFNVPPDLVALDGHFPGAPIVPGYTLVGWAARMASVVFGNCGSIASARNIKFLQPVTPGSRLRLELRREPGQDENHFVHFVLHSDVDNGQIARGVLTLRSFE